VNTDRRLLELTYVPPGELGVDVVVFDTETDEYPFQVRWTDRVANVWTEHYADLAVALTRAALVLRAAQRGRLFLHRTDDAQLLDGTTGPAAFVHDALTFLDDQLS
jgi:hypothetical protein